MRTEEERKVEGGINRNVHHFMHPFSSSYLRLFESGSRLGRVFLASLPSDIFQLFLKNPEVFPGQMRYVIPPASSRSTPRSPSSWTAPNLQRKVPRVASWSDARTTSDVSFALLRAPPGYPSSSPPSNVRLSPATLQRNSSRQLYPQSDPFCLFKSSRPRSRWGLEHRSKAFTSAPCSPRRFRVTQPALLKCSCVYSGSDSQTSDNCCCIDGDTRQMLMRWKFLRVE